MINKANHGYYRVDGTCDFLREIKEEGDLQNKLKSLSSKDKELIAIALGVAKKRKNLCTRRIPKGGEGEATMKNLLASDIHERFTEVLGKLNEATPKTKKSNPLLRALKGAGNMLGRNSCASLTRKIEELEFPETLD